MTNNITDLQSIYQTVLNKIVNSEGKWKSFLKFASRIHKYPFDQAVLVYAQNPDVTMLASSKIWSRFDREIIPESKAIMVYKYVDGQRAVDHLFDITQTAGKHIENPLWAILSYERDYIAKALSKENIEQSLEDEIDDFSKGIVRETYLSVEDHCENIINQFAGNDREVSLANFLTLVTASTQYAVREKCGLVQNENKLNFSFLQHTKDLTQINLLGYLVSTSTKKVMSRIANLKKAYEMERVDHNDSKHLLSEEGRRATLSELTNQQPSGVRQAPGDVREKSNELPSGNESNPISRATNEWNINGENASSGRRSERKDSQSNEGTGETKSNSGDPEHFLKNEPQEHAKKSSRRDNTKGIRRSSKIENNVKAKEPDSKESGSFILKENESEQLELFNDWDSIEESKEMQHGSTPSTETETASISQKDIDKILIRGTGFENGKFRVVDFFATNPTEKETVSFLKKEYGIGGWGGPREPSVMHDSKGITITKGSLLNTNAEKIIKWSDVGTRLKRLIDLDRYLTPDEKIELESYHQEVAKNKIEDTNGSSNDEQIMKEQILEHEEKRIIQNYHYNVSDNLYESGDKTKFKNNVAAIRLLKQLEMNKEIATPDQQRILAKYVGWGGLSNVFSEDHEKWTKEHQELKALLTDREYQEAMESTITAFYTEPAIIEKMYKALHNFGFEKGSILDPAMGTGNFFSVIPESLAESTLTGVEIDSITGRLAKQLYPQSEILVQGFETANFQENQFDVVIGNIPFNNIQIEDPRYGDYNFLIHDYFIARSLDVVKPGGIIAVITSKGTMDKKNKEVREYIAARSELLGAVRLPNNAFKALAGTEVTTDILFLKKREEAINILDPSLRPNWIDTKPLPNNGIEINNYFIENPNMVLGKIMHDGFYDGSRQYACVPQEGQELLPALDQAIESIRGTFTAQKFIDSEKIEKETDQVIKFMAPPEGTKNFTYIVLEDGLYFHENNKLIPQNLSSKETERIKGMCDIRTSLLDVIHIQTGTYQEIELKELQEILNTKYDTFVKKFGYLSDRVNQKAFYEDDQLPLLLSIEDEQNDKTFKKADIFYKATIRPNIKRNYAESAQEALEMSLNRNMRVDIPYMASLCQSSPEAIILELGNRIYLNPKNYTGDSTKGWETSDEYLTGNVHDKLNYARLQAEKSPELFQRNVAALEDVQPPRLLPGDINFSIGSPWIPKEHYQEFMYDLLGTSEFNRTNQYGIKIEYFPFTNSWRIEGKDRESYSVKANSVYGTKRRNAYQIFEDCLNLQDATVRDPEKYMDPNGNEQTRYVVNPKETMIARSKQQQIQEAFQGWLFKESKRSEELLQIYNDNYNTIRPRTYNGEFLSFPGMNEEMQLRGHQKNVVARILSTGGALMAHEVGAGKTAAMIAAGMRLKQIGAVRKPMFVVMNHTIDQWAKEILRFYPSANVLITTKKDFEKKNRQRFVSKIATGDYDAVIIGHSQFEKIPISKERQENILRKEINTLTYEIKQAKKEKGNNWSVKQLVIFQKSLENRLKKLVNDSKKDDVINFEELGVDCLFVDEAHVYKNLYTMTKLKNVAGIGTSSSQRATDMKMKCEYIQEQNQGRGVIFATGTPVTNSMSELFVMQRFLQPDALQRVGLGFFDNWAGTFGEVVSSLEMTPEGSGYRMKSRFAKFHNLPELMNMFNLVADIQTAEMLQLPVPKLQNGKAQIIVSECSDFQKKMMAAFVERSEKIRNGEVDPSIDNMLKLTHEAKLMAIDPRLINENATVNETSKLNRCVKNVFKIWDETKEKKSTQMIFCDSGTPKPNQFNVYDEIKSQLVTKGVPAEEIAFIHDAKTDVQRDRLFSQVRKGEVRVLIGSTSKVGTGTNVQDRLIAGHHIDCPWRPADLTQRDGRILRQGNMNEEVAIFRYVTKGTFDGYLWQIQEQKLKYISQVMTGKNISRSCDDTDETVLTAAEVKAIATDNPLLLQKMTLDNEVNRLKLVRNRWSNEKATMEKNLAKTYPDRIKHCREQIAHIQSDLSVALRNKGESIKIDLEGMTFIDEKEASDALKTIIKEKSLIDDVPITIGKYRGLEVFVRRNIMYETCIGLQGESQHEVRMTERAIFNRFDKLVSDYPLKIEELQNNISQVETQMKDIELELKKPFQYEDVLKDLLKKQTNLNLQMEFKEQINKSNSKDNEKEVSIEKDEVKLKTPKINEERSIKKKRKESLDLDL